MAKLKSTTVKIDVLEFAILLHLIKRNEEKGDYFGNAEHFNKRQLDLKHKLENAELALKQKCEQGEK